MQSRPIIISLAFAVLSCAAGRLQAQACIGSPAEVRGYSLAPTISVERNVGVFVDENGGAMETVGTRRTYGLELGVRPLRTLTLRAGYGLNRLPVDILRHRISGNAALEVAHGKGSLCATGGIDYARLSTVVLSFWSDQPSGSAVAADLTAADLVLPLGMAAGTSIQLAPGTPLSLYLQPQVLLIRSGSRYRLVSRPSFQDSFSEWTQQAGVEVGGRLRRGPLFGGASYLHTTWGNRQNTFTFTAGYVGGW